MDDDDAQQPALVVGCAGSSAESTSTNRPDAQQDDDTQQPHDDTQQPYDDPSPTIGPSTSDKADSDE
eukprot:16438444-Heterocapsa_arctica.AAC.1